MNLARLLFVAILAFASNAAAQTIAITGRVADPQGAVVVGAEVVLRGADAPRTLSTRSASDGTFTFEQVATGRYLLQVEAPGFLRWTQDITARGDLSPLTVTLRVAGINEDVTVVGAAGLNLSRPSPTASRLGLTPMQTPGSVHVMTGELIRARGDAAISEATTRAVGMTTNWTVGNGGGGLTTRGFGGPGSILQLYDGVQLFIGAHTESFPFDTWSVDRIEVLGGPSSVLFGNGAIGGVVNVVSRAPNRVAFENAGRVSFGSDNTWRGAFDSTGPLNERTSYRVAISQSNSDGWLERGDNSGTSLSASLRHDFSPKLSLTLSEDYGYQKPPNYYGVPLINGVLDESLRHVNYNVSDAKTLFKDNRTHLKTEWTPSANVSVRNNLYFLTVDRLWHRAGNYTFRPQTNQILVDRIMEVTHDQDQVGNRTDATVRGVLLGRENTFSVGVEYDWIRFWFSHNNPAAGSRLVSLTGGAPASFTDLALSPVLPRALSRTNAVSTFAENRLAVTPRLSVVGGIRYDHYNTDRSDLVTLADSTRTFTPVTGRGGFVYDVRPDLALYGQYATANDSIGELISQSPAEQAWDLTRGRQVEFGAKQSVLQNRAEWTVAAYRLVKQKLLVPNPNDPRLSEQVGQQSSVGLEVSTAFALGHGVRIDANGTVLKAKFDDFAQVVSGAIVSRDGNRPTNVPLQAANLWLTWSPQPAWQVRTGLRYVGDRFIDAANLWRMPSYTVVDAGVRRSLGRRTAVDVRLFNMFDEVYARGFWNGNAAAQQWLLGAPRAAELSLTTSF